ncbi:MAG TPA: hypothetical protein VGN51_07255 [Acidimicrobiia bacterium]|jgi:hypothetical protein
MLNETQTVIAVAGVCVLALVLIVLGRRRRNTEGRGTNDHVVNAGVVDAVVVDEPGRLVLARTHDGTQYQGTLAEPGDPGQPGANGGYLTLTGTIVFRRAGGEPETMPSAWDRLALPLADVAEVWTRPAATTPAAPSPAPVPASSTEDAVARLREGVDGEPSADAPTTRRHTRRERRSPVITP